MHYPGAAFSVNTTAGDAPLIVFAIKEPRKLISILGNKKKKKKTEKLTQMELFKFHIDFFFSRRTGN